MEHLARLQEVGKSLVDGVSDVIERIKGMNIEQFEEPGVEQLIDAFARVKFNSLWPSIKGHLGISGEKMETMIKDFSQNVCNWAVYGWPYKDESDFKNFKQKLGRYVLTKIAPLSDFAYFGLHARNGHRFNETCPYCPIQKT